MVLAFTRFTLEQATKALAGSKVYLYSFFNLGDKIGGGGGRHAPAAIPPVKTRYPLYRRLGGLETGSGRVRKISPPPGFDLRTVHPVASRYTDCAVLS